MYSKNERDREKDMWEKRPGKDWKFNLPASDLGIKGKIWSDNDFLEVLKGAN